MMNPGALEEGAKAAGTLITTLGSQPAVLALIVISFGLLGYVYYESNHFYTGRQEILKAFLDQQTEVQRLLARCVVPTDKN